MEDWMSGWLDEWREAVDSALCVVCKRHFLSIDHLVAMTVIVLLPMRYSPFFCLRVFVAMICAVPHIGIGIDIGIALRPPHSIADAGTAFVPLQNGRRGRAAPPCSTTQPQLHYSTTQPPNNLTTFS